MNDLMVEDYTILESYDANQMTEKVKCLLVQGWVIHGSLIVVADDLLMQAMIKYPDAIRDTLKAMLNELEVV